MTLIRHVIGGNVFPWVSNMAGVDEQSVAKDGSLLFVNFIVDRFTREGVPNAPSVDELSGTSLGIESVKLWVEVGSALRTLGDAFERDIQLQRLIDGVPDDSHIEAIMTVAQVLFGDGEVTWERIIGLFYFAYKMCLMAMKRLHAANIVEWIQGLAKEIINFLVKKFSSWIISRGGWLAIKEIFGTPRWLWRSLMVVSLSIFVYTLWRRSES